MEYEDRLSISTPEGVELEMTLAGIGSRFMASLIDQAIQFAIIVAGIAILLGVSEVTVSGGQAGAESDSGLALGIAIITIFSFLVIFVYDVLFEVRGGGRTPGKRWTGLRVVRTGGRPVDFMASATRNVLRVVDMLPGFYAVAMATIFATQRNQRLGDIAAGTVVVREHRPDREARKPGAPQFVKAPGPPPPAPVVVDTTGWDVSAIGADEVATVRRFLERRSTLAGDARRRLAADLAERLRPRVAGVPESVSAETFLEGLSAAKAARS